MRKNHGVSRSPEQPSRFEENPRVQHVLDAARRMIPLRRSGDKGRRQAWSDLDHSLEFWLRNHTRNRSDMNLTQEEAVAYIQDLVTRGVTAEEIRRRRSNLALVWDGVCYESNLEDNPWRMVKGPRVAAKPGKHAKNAPSRAQIELILDKCVEDGRPVALRDALLVLTVALPISIEAVQALVPWNFQCLSGPEFKIECEDGQFLPIFFSSKPELTEFLNRLEEQYPSWPVFVGYERNGLEPRPLEKSWSPPRPMDLSSIYRALDKHGKSIGRHEGLSPSSLKAFYQNETKVRQEEARLHREGARKKKGKRKVAKKKRKNL